MTYTFKIDGRIKPKERPRRARNGHFYTPIATIKSEAIIDQTARQGGLKGIPGPLAIEARFFGNYATSDLDNLIKTLLDGCQHFFNDRNVVAIRAFKEQNKEHWTEVKITEIFT